MCNSVQVVICTCTNICPRLYFHACSPMSIHAVLDPVTFYKPRGGAGNLFGFWWQSGVISSEVVMEGSLGSQNLTFSLLTSWLRNSCNFSPSVGLPRLTSV